MVTIGLPASSRTTVGLPTARLLVPGAALGYVAAANYHCQPAVGVFIALRLTCNHVGRSCFWGLVDGHRSISAQVRCCSPYVAGCRQHPMPIKPHGRGSSAPITAQPVPAGKGLSLAT